MNHLPAALSPDYLFIHCSCPSTDVISTFLSDQDSLKSRAESVPSDQSLLRTQMGQIQSQLTQTDPN